jgi:hypothetical protein
MNRWGSWELTHDGQVLTHDGGYAIALSDVDLDPDGRDVIWWLAHLDGKDWVTHRVAMDFTRAMDATGRVAS